MHLHRHRPASRTTRLLAVGVVAALLGGCSSPEPTPSTSDAAVPHGFVDGADELSEPQLSLITANADGGLTLRDLVTEEDTPLLDPASADVTGMVGDGRFIFRVEQSADLTTVRIVDSGAWTVEHGDHFHYYAAEPRTIGTIDGEGPAVIHSADRRTAITFPEMGEVIVVSHDALEDGEIGEPTSASITPHPGALAVPFGGVLLVTVPDEDGMPSRVETIPQASDGSAVSAPCPEATSATITRVGAVFACRTGAVLATASDDVVTFEEIPYPAGVAAPPAASLQGRAGRTSVASPAGEAGAWRLNSRARDWVFLPSDVPLVAVSAVSDDAELVIALDSSGRIRVMDAAGATLAVTETVLAASIADPVTRSQVRLIVDAQRAYVSDPAQNRILEIDYRDDARISRTFSVAGAAFLEQVG